MARADKREEEYGEGSTHSSTERGRREKGLPGRRKREKRNPSVRKVGREMKIYGQPDTEIYPQKENKIRGKKSLIGERGEVREIKGRKIRVRVLSGDKT